MKLLVRTLGITIIGIIVSIGMIYLINTNIIINELNECSSLAMVQTQKSIVQSIKDKLDLIENNDFDNNKYKEYYKDHFLTFVNNSSIYDIFVDCNIDKGIIYAEITVPRYKLIPTKKLLSIIDIKGDDLSDLESLQYDIVYTPKNSRGGTSIKGISAGTLKKLPEEYDGEIREYSYNLTVYATESRSPTTSNSIGPYIEIRCTNKDDEVEVIDSAEGGDRAFTLLKSEETHSCKLFEVVMPNNLDLTKYSVEANTVAIKNNSLVVENTISKTRKEDLHLSDEVDINYRFIDDENSLNVRSIWYQNNQYRKELEDYLRYVK